MVSVVTGARAGAAGRRGRLGTGSGGRQRVLAQALFELVGEIAQTLVAGINDEAGDFAVQRVALEKQLLQPPARIRGLQQRAVAVVPCALP